MAKAWPQSSSSRYRSDKRASRGVKHTCPQKSRSPTPRMRKPTYSKGTTLKQNIERHFKILMVCRIHHNDNHTQWMCTVPEGFAHPRQSVWPVHQRGEWWQAPKGLLKTAARWMAVVCHNCCCSGHWLSQSEGWTRGQALDQCLWTEPGKHRRGHKQRWQNYIEGKQPTSWKKFRCYLRTIWI